jgi:hypothetical protein
MAPTSPSISQKKGDQTEVRRTHVGVVPAVECFANCSDAWGSYIKASLRDLIATGKREPNKEDHYGRGAAHLGLGLAQP